MAQDIPQGVPLQLFRVGRQQLIDLPEKGQDNERHDHGQEDGQRHERQDNSRRPGRMHARLAQFDPAKRARYRIQGERQPDGEDDRQQDRRQFVHQERQAREDQDLQRSMLLDIMQNSIVHGHFPRMFPVLPSRPKERAGGSGQKVLPDRIHCRNGLRFRSQPTVVAGPCPGSRTTSSAKGRIFVWMEVSS